MKRHNRTEANPLNVEKFYKTLAELYARQNCCKVSVIVRKKDTSRAS